MTATALLELKGVSKRFGAVQALTTVDFEVCPGEVVALVGDNGAGKSTLIKIISGIIPIDEGQVLFEGRPVSLHGAAGRHVAGNRHRVPGPRAVRQPGRRGQPVPRARAARGGLGQARRVAG